jgi:transposase
MTQRTTRKRDQARESAEWEAVHPDAAGIDVGSRKHFVAVPPGRDAEPVRSFGATTPDLHAMGRWLAECGVRTAALESTGVYWMPVAQVLEAHGIEVVLVDARRVKAVPGRKSDVQDCQWLQRLHTFGLLAGAFRPTPEIGVLRAYWRHRATLVEESSRHILRMQKALDQMNLHLHQALSDVTGVTGMRIVRAILAGERDPQALARLRHPQVKSTPEELVKALTGDWRAEHLFALRQAVELYHVLQDQIAACDREIEQALGAFPAAGAAPPAPEASRRKPRKNQPRFDLRAELVRLTGVDLTRIDGIDAMTAFTVITEQGIDMARFPTEKKFASHLGLCPHNRITGGKIKAARTRGGPSRAATALRLAAQSLHASRSALGAYYRRMRHRLDPAQAITAVAHKLAQIVYRMLRHGQEYVDRGQEAYEQQFQDRVVKNLKRKAKHLGYQLVALPAGGAVS